MGAVAAVDAEAWLAAHAVECAKKSARISPQVCRDYQRRDPVNCVGCERLGLSEEQVAATAEVNAGPGLARIDEMKRKELREVAKVGACRACEKERTLVSRGLCSSCWLRAKRLGVLDELYPVKGSVSKREDGVKDEDLGAVDEGAGDVVVGGEEEEELCLKKMDASRLVAGKISGLDVVNAFREAEMPPGAVQVGGDHYRRLAVQPWEAMEAWLSPDEFAGFLRGNVIKYMARFRDKGGVEDVRKARHYLDRLIELLEATE